PDSRARIFLQRVSERAYRRETAVVFSIESWTPFAFYDPTTSCWKTSPHSDGKTGDSEKFSHTWPKQGMTCSGQAFAPATSGRRTGVSASSSSPVPVTALRKQSRH